MVELSVSICADEGGFLRGPLPRRDGWIVHSVPSLTQRSQGPCAVSDARFAPTHLWRVAQADAARFDGATGHAGRRRALELGLGPLRARRALRGRRRRRCDGLHGRRALERGRRRHGHAVRHAAGARAGEVESVKSDLLRCAGTTRGGLDSVLELEDAPRDEAGARAVASSTSLAPSPERLRPGQAVTEMLFRELGTLADWERTEREVAWS